MTQPVLLLLTWEVTTGARAKMLIDVTSQAARRLNRASLVAAFAASCVLSACQSSPTAPNETPLAVGRWTGSGACLSVTATGCDLAVGCGHGQFPRPSIRANGTFDVDGTYRLEAGPVSIEPAPPAHFSGSVIGSRLILNVVRTDEPVPPAAYSMTPTTAGTCPIPCL